MIERTAKAVILVLCPFLGYGFGFALYESLARARPESGLLLFGFGFAAFYAFWLLFRKWLVFICTLEHEITHLLFGLLFLKLPRGFRVTLHEGGHVKLKGSNFLIYLAPYFFPTISFALLILLVFIPPDYRTPAYALLGASAAFHLVSTWADLRPGQTDLRKAGLIFSLVFLPPANLAAYGSLLAFVTGGLPQVADFWRTAASYSISIFTFQAGA